MKKLRTKLLASVLVLALILQFFPVRAFANDNQDVVPAEEPGVVQEVEAEVPAEEEVVLPEEQAEEAAAPEEGTSEEVQEEPAEDLPEEEPEEQPAEKPESALPEASSAPEKQAGTKGDKDPAVTETFEVWAEIETFSNADKNIHFAYDGQTHTWGGDQSYSIHFYKESKQTPMTEISLAEVQALGFTVNVSARHMDGTVDSNFNVASADVYIVESGSMMVRPKQYRPYFDVVVNITGTVSGYESDGEVSGKVELVIDQAPATVKVTGRSQTITYDAKDHFGPGYEIEVVEDPLGQYSTKSVEIMLKMRSQRYAGTYKTGPASLNNAANNRDSNYFVTFIVEQGEFIITPAPLTVTTGSKRAPAGTAELTYDHYEVTGLLGDDKVDVKVTGRQVGEGTSKNTCEEAVFANDSLKKSYEVTYVYGDLTIAGENEVLITVDVKADKKVTYNGQEQTLTADPEDFHFSVDNPRYSLDNISVSHSVSVTGTDADTPHRCTGHRSGAADRGDRLREQAL